MPIGLLLELRPMKVLFPRDAYDHYENFTCSYYAYERHRIVITAEPNLLEGHGPVALTDTKIPYSTQEYRNGEKHFITLRLFNGHRTVTCRVFDADDKEVAQMVSQIMYVRRGRRQRESHL